MSGTGLPEPQPETLAGLLLRAWTAAADQVAVEADEVTLTYGALTDRVTRLAAVLAAHGVGPGQRVAVLLDRSADLVVALAAVVFAGGVQLSVDPGDPDDRILFMISDSAPAVVITSAAHRSRLGHPTCRVLLVEDLCSTAPGGSAAPPVRHRPDSPVYAVYTSGSTGRPKASLIPHRALVSRLRWLQRVCRLTPDDRVLYKTSCGFDVSVAELYWPLSAAAQLVVAAPGGQRDPDYLAEAVLARGITTLHFVPSLLELFLSGRPATETYPGLRQLLVAGEALAPELVRRFHERTPATMYNLYGPSECAIYATAWECPRDPGLDRVLIGTAVDDTELWVLDAQRQPVADGEEGELFIGGAGLASGYLNRSELTAERFVPHQLGSPGTRLYRSGDLVRAHPGGALEFRGRSDSQVKIRGNRVEPGEVENTMLAIPGVARAAVVAAERDGHTELAGFFVPARLRAPSAEEVRRALRTALPSYMIPSVLRPLDDLPLTANGKLDRAALTDLARTVSALATPAPGTAGPDGPAHPVERRVAEVWGEVLSLPVGRDDDFFDLGGDSLAALKATQQLGRLLGTEIPLRLIYRESALCSYADEVEVLTGGAGAAQERPRRTRAHG